MSTKSETVVVRVCGKCAYAKETLESAEIVDSERTYLRHQNSIYLALLRRRTNPLRDSKVFCRKENIEVGVFEEACAFWNEK